jgi:hypothetical protein
VSVSSPNRQLRLGKQPAGVVPFQPAAEAESFFVPVSARPKSCPFKAVKVSLYAKKGGHPLRTTAFFI